MRKLLFLMLAALLLLTLAACGTDRSPDRQSDSAAGAPVGRASAAAEASATEPAASEQVGHVPANEEDAGAAALQYQYLALPSELEQGMTARECSLQPIPSTEAPELAGLWMHHRVRVVFAVDVYDNLRETNSRWYFVSLLPMPEGAYSVEGLSVVGWLPEDCVIPYDAAAPLPENAMYCLKDGAEYCVGEGFSADGSGGRLLKNTGAGRDGTAYRIRQTDETTGRILLTGGGGATISVAHMDALEPADFAWFSPAWSNAE